jgi:2-dehydro-3-deoxyphosphogluconate aldolase/(4S)-4-hydroxy-2-oxoglutarate aldolase
VSARPALPAGLLACGVVAIARRFGADAAPRVADALVEGGVVAFELTLNDPEAGALAAIEAVARHTEGGPLTVGGGTVLTTAAAGRAVDAGARFLVAPHTDPDLVAWAAERGIPFLPGALTPSEALAGWRAGAAAIKLFPASVAGPQFIRELRGPFPEIPVLPTGGITADTAASYIRAGAVAIGLGTWLTGDGEPAGISARARQLVASVADARAAD